MKLNARKGQNVIEYAILLTLVIAALTVMQVYIKRGIQAGIKSCGDQIGKQEDFVEEDPIKGRLEHAESIDIADGTTTSTYGGGTQEYTTSQTTTKGEGSHSLYRAGFTEGSSE